VGEKEVEAGKIAIRKRDGTDLGQMSVQDFTKNLLKEIKEKK
jgi:threonyl-tRNA synthetase